MNSLDTIFFAVVAVILIARLWAVFGRRNDSDAQRPNPFVMPAPPPQPNANTPPQAKIAGRSPSPMPIVRLAPDSLAGGLEAIKAQDATFDEKAFLQGARTAFAMIVEDFAKGDLIRSAHLLGPEVLPHFQRAIDARKQAGQVMECRIARITDVETSVARVDGAKAFITVRFVSAQENVLRDAEKRVVGGEAGRVEEVIDSWVFARDAKATTAPWIVVETRS
jgi:predicted lipid-binding transport protein (Tim44 family)